MSRDRFQEIIASLSTDQVAALRVSIMAERRLRTLYPRDPARDGSALNEAYDWALQQTP